MRPIVVSLCYENNIRVHYMMMLYWQLAIALTTLIYDNYQGFIGEEFSQFCIII